MSVTDPAFLADLRKRLNCSPEEAVAIASVIEAALARMSREAAEAAERDPDHARRERRRRERKLRDLQEVAVGIQERALSAPRSSVGNDCAGLDFAIMAIGMLEVEERAIRMEGMPIRGRGRNRALPETDALWPLLLLVWESWQSIPPDAATSPFVEFVGSVHELAGLLPPVPETLRRAIRRHNASRPVRDQLAHLATVYPRPDS